MLNFKLTISENLVENFSPRRFSIVEAIAQGLSNKAIAQELGITVKAVEQSITAINKNLGHSFNGFYNSRVRLLSSLVSKEQIGFTSEFNLNKVELKDSLNQTLILTCAGLSNKIIATLLKCSDKNIEQRLGQLFDYFGVETKNQETENPRVLLFINSFIRQNIQAEQITRLYDKTEAEKLRRIMQEPELFIATLDCNQHIIG